MADMTQYNNGQAFDGTGFPASREFSPLPAGEYGVLIKDACIKPTRAGNGCYAELAMEVLNSNRKVWWRITIQNPSVKATEIGKEQMNSLREAVGLVSLSDTDELIGKHITVKLSVRDQYNDVDYCKAYVAPAEMPKVAAAPAWSPTPAAPPAWPGAAPAVHAVPPIPAVDEVPF